MTANKRIFLNVVATYGRSLYALALGLFTARWALEALGKIDYGLVGLIGGLIGFVSFFNSLLASAVGRFYAVNVGAAKKAGNNQLGFIECCRWFNTAISIHTVVPVALVIIGYPLGVWAVENFLTIPPDRVASCVWVWRFTCLSCFISMASVPFQAMYTAKQEIAELTVYSFVTTTLNACFLYYMITHPGVWLAKYSAWTCLIAIVPQIIIGLRAFVKYPECRIVPQFFWSMDRIKQLSVFVFSKFWSDFSSAFSTQGQAILVNKYMGPIYNAAMTVGNQVGNHSLTLSSAIDGAFWPAITNKTGEGAHEEVKRLCFTAMRLSPLMVLIFAIPLSCEIHNVLRLWLVNPPDFAAEICLIFLARAVLERMTSAYATAIYGYGKGVVKYAWTVGWAGISTVLVSWLFFALGFGMWSIIIGLTCSKLITVGTRLWLGRTIIGFSFRYWLRIVFAPIALLLIIVLTVGMLPRIFLKETFVRIAITTGVCELFLLPLAWFVVMSRQERNFFLRKFKKDHK